jgi:hypothetical protein
LAAAGVSVAPSSTSRTAKRSAASSCATTPGALNQTLSTFAANMRANATYQLSIARSGYASPPAMSSGSGAARMIVLASGRTTASSQTRASRRV